MILDSHIGSEQEFFTSKQRPQTTGICHMQKTPAVPAAQRRHGETRDRCAWGNGVSSFARRSDRNAEQISTMALTLQRCQNVRLNGPVGPERGVVVHPASRQQSDRRWGQRVTQHESTVTFAT